MSTRDPRPRGGWTMTRHQRRLLMAAVLAFVSYKALRDALTTEAGLVEGRGTSAAVAVVLCAALPLCGRLPVTIAVVALAGFVLDSQVWPVLIALYAVAVRRPPALALALTGAAYVPAAFAPFRELLNMPLLTFMPCAMLIVPVAFGLAARNHRELARSLARQLQDTEAANRLRDERVRLSERARIAREMHDVLAHRLSLLVLQTGVLQRRGTEVPEPVRERLDLLRDTSANALDDLRDLLGALRDHEGPVPLTPTSDDLPALIADAEAAGTRVHARIAPLAELPAAVRLAVHRIVQEALTNARKHAPTAPVELTVTVERARVEVRAANICPPATAFTSTESGSRGYGLVGVAERVAAMHGDMTATRTDDGRFVLRAALPVPAHPADGAQAMENPPHGAPATQDMAPAGEATL
ncbi:histidine kinase [Streptomyces sp. DG2A-72]|uniref:sensor histidine kinase n=1 Tax=Streptomyces sp. DG2A-72 TaxID=3051386 RepID=UPI00265BC69A|nr:histidine kinase [Streptomyces sp. DG2A-72]MDO0930313.1 histidine kinase [Streptomyces sp. DG2A-72]